jgi:hypothetical protein
MSSGFEGFLLFLKSDNWLTRQLPERPDSQPVGDL